MSNYISLLAALKGCFEKQLDELPDALRERVVRDFPMPWVKLSPEQRRHWASKNDEQFGPKAALKLQRLLDEYGVTEPVQLTAQDVFKRKAMLLQKIMEVNDSLTLTDATKNLQLQDLRLEHQKLEEQQARGDYPELTDRKNYTKPPGHLNHDLEWQEMANQIAKQKMTETGKRITRNDAAKLLAKNIGETVDTVLRRIRKEW